MPDNVDNPTKKTHKKESIPDVPFSPKNEPLDLVKHFAHELDMVSTKRPDLHQEAIDALERLLWFLRANLELHEGRVSVEESTWLNLLIEIIKRIDPVFSLEMLSEDERQLMDELFYGFDDTNSAGSYI